MRPRAVTISTRDCASNAICVTGVRSCTGMPSASFATSAPSPGGRTRRCRARPSLAKSHRRNLGEILAAAERPERELDRSAASRRDPSAAPARSDMSLLPRAASCDRAVGAHDRREIILDLAFARDCAGRCAALPRRRRIDVEAGARRELGQRIDVGQVHPVRAAIERHAEAARIGEAAPADAVARLDQREAPARGRDLRAAAMPAAPAPMIVDVGLAREAGDRAERRRGREGGGACEKSAAVELPWFPESLSPRRNIASIACRLFANSAVD